MKRIILFTALLLALGGVSHAQQSVVQGGPLTFGHAPMYIAAPGGRAMVGDSGGAAGGPIGTGLAELGLTARGTGTPPYVGQGTGPLGAVDCEYDAPTNNATGYHFLCFSPDDLINGSHGAFLIYGGGGGAASLPLYIDVNGLVSSLPPLIATASDVNAGTSTSKMVTPSALSISLAAQTVVESSNSALINWQNGSYVRIDLNGNLTSLVLTNPIDGGIYNIDIQQPGSGGPYTVTWPANVDWGDSGTPVLSTSVNATDQIVLKYNGKTSRYQAAIATGF